MCCPHIEEYNTAIKNKKAVLSQRWPRDARYTSSRSGDMAIRN